MSSKKLFTSLFLIFALIMTSGLEVQAKSKGHGKKSHAAQTKKKKVIAKSEKKQKREIASAKKDKKQKRDVASKSKNKKKKHSKKSKSRK